jgi:trans-aconitate 2-methyltransferase
MLDPDEARGFEDEYRKRLRAAYPQTPHGTLFPFKRLFFVATRD